MVFHCFWWNFASLYHYRPNGRYVVGLDPVFHFRADEALFQKSLRAYRGRSRDLFSVLQEDFGATWVYAPKGARYAPFRQLLRVDPRFELAYENQSVLIYRLPGM